MNELWSLGLEAAKVISREMDNTFDGDKGIDYVIKAKKLLELRYPDISPSDRKEILLVLTPARFRFEGDDA